ncbi:MAG: ABC transporter permease, partial [Candidatus Binatia bacterium]
MPSGRGFSQEAIVLAVTAAMVGVFAVTLPGFLSTDNLLNLARTVAPLGVLGIAMAIVVIGGGIDLSLIATMGVATALTVEQMHDPAATTIGALAVGLGVAVGMGCLNGFLIAFVEVPALFTTLASGLFVYGVARTFLLSGVIAEVPPDRLFLRALGQSSVLGVPVPILVLAATIGFAGFLLSRTALGRFVYAHGDNAEAASLTGIAIRPLTFVEYTLSAVFGYVAGLVMAGAVDGFNTQVIDSTLIYDVLLVVVVGGVSLVGGRGGVTSVFAGISLIGVLLNGMTLADLNVYQQNIVKGLILLAALVL